jgi:hypothetical protein
MFLPVGLRASIRWLPCGMNSGGGFRQASGIARYGRTPVLTRMYGGRFSSSRDGLVLLIRKSVSQNRTAIDVRRTGL